MHQLYRRLPLGLAVGALLYSASDRRHEFHMAFNTAVPTPGEFRQGLPEYTRAEVAQHHCVEKRVWITYKSGVYDVTNFLPEHPGGKKIMMAAGSAADPFWDVYFVHNRSEVSRVLESMRIGNLKKSEKPIQSKDPYSSDPERHLGLKVISEKPFNAETPATVLNDTSLTPNELSFVRNHLPVPNIDPETYKLAITWNGIKSQEFSLSFIKSKFAHRHVVTTIQCAGNRRAGMGCVAPVKGLAWDVGAVSTARWTGVLVKDLLAHAGYPATDKQIHHIRFIGYDHDPDSFYETSIPVERVMDPANDVILAFEMNEKEIPRDHGFPLRVIVPGVAGVRNVKWLKSIMVSDRESDSIWQKRDYKVFPADADPGNLDYQSTSPIYDLPVTSAITSHQEGEVLDPVNKTLELEGYALSGDGRHINRVEVTINDGKNWTTAYLRKPEEKKSWALTKWKAVIPFPKTDVKACVRAVDSSYNTQPKTAEEIWNFRGLVNNSWHCLNLKRGTTASSNK